MATTAPAGDAGEWSYWRALRSGRLGALLAGNLISSTGNGMIISALPLLTLQSAITWTPSSRGVGMRVFVAGATGNA